MFLTDIAANAGLLALAGSLPILFKYWFRDRAVKRALEAKSHVVVIQEGQFSIKVDPHALPLHQGGVSATATSPEPETAQGAAGEDRAGEVGGR